MFFNVTTFAVCCVCVSLSQVVIIRVAAAARPHSVSVHPAGTGQASPLAAHPVSTHTFALLYLFDRNHTTLDRWSGCPLLLAEEFVFLPTG